MLVVRPELITEKKNVGSSQFLEWSFCFLTEPVRSSINFLWEQTLHLDEILYDLGNNAKHTHCHCSRAFLVISKPIEIDSSNKCLSPYKRPSSVCNKLYRPKLPAIKKKKGWISCDFVFLSLPYFPKLPILTMQTRKWRKIIAEIGFANLEVIDHKFV